MRNNLVFNLPQLQNLIKRDSQSYREEFMTQYRHFLSALAIFDLDPAASSDEFANQVTFVSQVASCYPSETAAFPQTLVDLLAKHYVTMAPELRRTIVQALMLLRNRNMLAQTVLLSLFFSLFRCNDKQLRLILHSHIVNDIKNSNSKAKNNKLNKTLQNFMYEMLKDTSEIASKKSLEVMIELYKKNVWNDSKTVNIIAEACVSSLPKLVAPALHFFLGADKDDDDDDESDEDSMDISGLRHANGINRKTKSRKNQLEKAQAAVRRKERKRNKAEHFNFSALHLLNDPQGFAESLLSKLKMVTSKNIFKFELRMLMMSLISRLIGIHKLILLGFYDFLQSYLKPQQRDVTSILAYLAQSAHELVPPDALEVIVRTIADNFIWSNCASEVITAGLNALREICQRCPLAMPQDLLQSLVEDYKSHREKGPMNAARSLIGLYREFNPEMLKKKDRGKAASVGLKTFKPDKYGEINVADTVEGADLLLEEENNDDEEIPALVEDDEEESGSASCSNSDSDNDEEGKEESEDEELEIDSDDIESCAQDSDVEEDAECKEPPVTKAKRNIAMEKILTDEDFAKIKELRMEKEAEQLAGIKRKRPSKMAQDDDDDDDLVDVSKIMSGIRRKDDYEARMESIQAGREGREKFGSKKGKDVRSSLTNREKAKKNKPMLMLVHKRSVRAKAKASLRDKQKTLRAHIEKQKKKGM